MQNYWERGALAACRGRQLECDWWDKKSKTSNDADDLCSSVLHFYLNRLIFDSLKEHSLNQSPLENHVILLIKTISKKYIDIRMHFIAKKSINSSASRRTFYNKTVIFSGH